MSLINCIDELMADPEFENCIYTNGYYYWDLPHLYNAVLDGEAEDDDYEYETSTKGDIHRLNDEGELGRKAYRNLGDRVKFFTKLAKAEVKESGAEIDEALLQKIANEVEVDLDDDDDIAAILKKCKPRKKK